MAGVGHLKRICKDAFRVAGAVQETHEVDVGDQGRDFLRGLHFGASDRQFWEDEILRDRCSTSYDPWQAQYFRQVEWKNRKTH